MATEKRLIDANALKDKFMYLRKMWSETEIVLTINDAKTVDAVEVVHGRWKEIFLTGGFSEEWGYVCSECGCVVSERSGLGIRHYKQNQKLNFCPNCGAKMDGDRNG